MNDRARCPDRPPLAIPPHCVLPRHLYKCTLTTPDPLPSDDLTAMATPRHQPSDGEMSSRFRPRRDGGATTGLVRQHLPEGAAGAAVAARAAKHLVDATWWEMSLCPDATPPSPGAEARLWTQQRKYSMPAHLRSFWPEFARVCDTFEARRT